MSYKAKASAFITLRNAYFNITEFWKFGKNLSSLIKIKPVQCQKKKKFKKKVLQLEVVHYHCFLCLDKKP